MDLGFRPTEAEQRQIRKEAEEEVKKEMLEEAELDRLAAEAAKAVEAEAVGEVADLSDAELADSDLGAEPVDVDEPLEKVMPKDVGYESDEEEDGEKAVGVADVDDTGEVPFNSSPVDPFDGVSLGNGPNTPENPDEVFTDSGLPTPLHDSALGSIEEDPEDEGLVEGDDGSIPETKITPNWSVDETQTDSELDGGLDEPLPSDDDGLSAERSVEEDLNMKRKIVKRTLKALAEREEREMKEAAGKSVSTGNEGRGFAL